MRIAAAVMSWTRPVYLWRSLSTYLAAGVELVDVVLVQDGTVTEEERVRAEQCLALFDRFPAPHKRVYRREKNVGVTAGQLLLYDLIFEDMGYDAVFPLFDDLVLSPDFFLTGMVLAARVAAEVGDVVAQQYVDAVLMRDHGGIRTSTAFLCHYLGNFTTRATWQRLRPHVQEYVAAVLHPLQDRERPEAGFREPETLDRVRAWSGGKVGGADLALAIAHRRAEVLRAVPNHSRMAHIGEWGQYCDPATYAQIGFQKVKRSTFPRDTVLCVYTESPLEAAAPADLGDLP